jgi:regulator of protease activity HflC (stomatin/prohibitin superfamily)
MDSLFAWVGQLVEWFSRFFPRRVILNTTMGAIKYVRGSNIKVCGPGVHWYWPWTTEWFDYPTARQVDRLQTQTILTADGKPIIIGGTIVYQVTDLKLLVTRVHDAAIAVKDLAQTAIHNVCCEMTLAEIQAGQQRNTLDTKLKNEAKRTLTEYGVDVVKFTLYDLAPVRVLRLSQSTSQEEN